MASQPPSTIRPRTHTASLPPGYGGELQGCSHTTAGRSTLLAITGNKKSLINKPGVRWKYDRDFTASHFLQVDDRQSQRHLKEERQSTACHGSLHFSFTLIYYYTKLYIFSFQAQVSTVGSSVLTIGALDSGARTPQELSQSSVLELLLRAWT